MGCDIAGRTAHGVAHLAARARCAGCRCRFGARRASPPTDLAKRARRVLLRRTLVPSGLAAAWKQRRSILPGGPAQRGHWGTGRAALWWRAVGTDGSGKSTVADELEQHLQRLGFTTRTAYFGMARGNLPGVGIARQMLGIATPGGEVVAQDQPSVPGAAK